VLALLETPDLSWFDLRKYDGLAELDLVGWQRLIEIRVQLLSYLDERNIIKIKMVTENITLKFDQICFDNTVMLNAIVKNFDQLSKI